MTVLPDVCPDCLSAHCGGRCSDGFALHAARDLVDEPIDLTIVDPRPPSGLVSKLLDRGALANLPKPQPLIADTLDRHTVALLAGYWGTGKSFLALDWAACHASGKAWQGRSTDAGKVLYIAAEGAYGLHQRLTAWEYAWDHQIPADNFHVLPVPVNLGNRSQVAEACALIDGAGISMVVVDTAARCAVDLDENSAKDMGIVVDALYRMCDATDDGTVLVVHHTGKDRVTVRGSSAIEGGVDTVYQIEGDPGLLKLSRTKRKDGPRTDEHQLRLEPIPGTESVVILSTRGVDIRPTAQALMSTFMSTFSETGATKSEMRVASGLAPASFARALNDLVAQRFLVNTGTDKRPFYRMGDTGE